MASSLSRVLIVHNAYRNLGGEDSVVSSEIDLLSKNAIEVIKYRRSNDELKNMSSMQILSESLYCYRTVRDISDLVKATRPDIIHAHNTFPLISPSLYWVASSNKIPIVQTLHNFRVLCPQAMFLRNGKVCEDCLGKLPWRGAVRGCYRDSMAQSSVLVGMLSLHRALGTYSEKVTRYIALNAFCRTKFIEGGLPAERISIKSNFVDVPSMPSGCRLGGLFVGRLSYEKGIKTLADSIKFLTNPKIRIVGTGAEESVIAKDPHFDWVGSLSQEQVFSEMRQASWLVMPSIWYENFPRTLVEAFACELPVIASRLGAMAELIDDGVTGLLFNPGDPKDLAEKIQWAEDNPEEMRRMGENARAEYEAKYTADINYKQLIAIYEQAIEESRQNG